MLKKAMKHTFLSIRDINLVIFACVYELKFSVSPGMVHKFSIIKTSICRFQEVLLSNDGNYESHLDLAICLWESGDRQKECFHALLKVCAE